MTYVSIPLFVLVILLIVAFLFLLVIGFELTVYLYAKKINDSYERKDIKKYGTQDCDE